MDLDKEELEATKNKTADEMFEDLSYMKYRDEYHVYYFKYRNEACEDEIVIQFNELNNSIYKYIEDYNGKIIGHIGHVAITSDEIKIIHKKMQEMGWI